jgi:hypothetical protein
MQLFDYWCERPLLGGIRFPTQFCLNSIRAVLVYNSHLDLMKMYAISKPKMASEEKNATVKQTNTRISCPEESSVLSTVQFSILFFPTHCICRLCSTPLSLAFMVPMANMCFSGELKGNMMCLPEYCKSN